MIQNIQKVFRQHHIDLYLVGAAARHWLTHRTPGSPGVLEWIAMAHRKDVCRIAELPLLPHGAHGPLSLQLTHNNEPCLGFIYCISPGAEPRAALYKALAKRTFRIDAVAIQPALYQNEPEHQEHQEFQENQEHPNPQEAEVIDPFGGAQDLQDNQLQLIEGEEGQMMASNSLLMLRAGWLIGELGCTISPALQQSAFDNASRILYAPRDAWFREITGLLCTPHAGMGLDWLAETRLLGILLPEVHAMIGFAETSLHHHKDLWAHTKQVVEQATPTPLVRWAALLHDAGKTWTRTYTPPKEVHFYQHEELGAVLVEGIAARFGMESTFADALAFLVRHHQRPNAYQSDWTDAAVRRLIREAGDHIRPMLQLSRADFTSANPYKRQAATRLAHELSERVDAIQAQDSLQAPLPSGIGKAIIDAFGLTPGPHIGKIKRRLEAAIEADEIEAHQAAAHYIDYLRTQPSALQE